MDEVGTDRACQVYIACDAEPDSPPPAHRGYLPCQRRAFVLLGIVMPKDYSGRIIWQPRNGLPQPIRHALVGYQPLTRPSCLASGHHASLSGGRVSAVRKASLPLAGLMCIPPLGPEPAPYFALLAEIARRHDVTGLSMGMSADYPTAVMLGATAVRVGTAMFED